MPRDGSNVFSPPAGTLATSGTAIESAKYNAFVNDLVNDANTPRPVVAGGTGATTAADARTNLGLAIGSNVQAYDAGLQSIAGLTTAADRMIYTTASDTYAVTTLTSFGRSLLDDADAATARTTLGLGALATAANVTTAEINASAYASQAEAEAGTNNTKLMTPLRNLQAGVGAPHAVLEDQKASGTAGGTPASAGSWGTRTINTEVRDPAGIVTVASNQWTVTVDCWCLASAPATQSGVHQVRIWNVTDGVLAGTGTSEGTDSGNVVVTRSFVACPLTAGKTYRLEHRVATSTATVGWGRATSFGSEVYARVELWRI